MDPLGLEAAGGDSPDGGRVRNTAIRKNAVADIDEGHVREGAHPVGALPKKCDAHDSPAGGNDGGAGRPAEDSPRGSMVAGGILSFRQRASGSKPVTPSSPAPESPGSSRRAPFISFGRKSTAGSSEGSAPPTPSSGAGAGVAGSPGSGDERPTTSSTPKSRFTFSAVTSAMRIGMGGKKKKKQEEAAVEEAGIGTAEYEAQALLQAEAGILREVPPATRNSL
ncbi:hypothetical protein T484DRAFT_1845871 [Baffinella frigidus]|nr:hypothetical protein T484DRAFT_1845871 [Cryptophyta sp. CCMP2293]